VSGFAEILEVFSNWRKTVGTALGAKTPKFWFRLLDLRPRKQASRSENSCKTSRSRNLN
jgi:hypothetical protein